MVARLELVGGTTGPALGGRKATEEWTRHHDKRFLKERGNEVLPALASWVHKLDRAVPEYEHHLVEALWTYESLDIVEPKLLGQLLHARDPHARAAATRVIQQWQTRLDHPLEMLAER